MEDRTLLQNIRRASKVSLPALITMKLIVIAIPISQVVIGALYLHDCPKQPYIPIYLVVLGSFKLVLVVLSCLPCTQESEDGTQSPVSSLCTAWNSLITVFIFCWFITGNVWVYSIYQPSYDPHVDDYCNKTLYLFAFWYNTVVYILLGLIMLCGCCMLFCVSVLKCCGLGNDEGV